jgi:predicted SAM-dependent methyltransferase
MGIGALFGHRTVPPAPHRASQSQDIDTPAPPEAADPLSREALADRYLAGAGIEIGALHNPLKVPAAATVTYVDRMPNEELRSHYKKLGDTPLVAIDRYDDGERLTTFADCSQDFVIANHFLEHCESPLHAVHAMHRVLKTGGVLYLAVPDKRYTFDNVRPVTPFAHVWRDYQEGPAWSRSTHFEEWARHCWQVDRVKSEDEILAQARHFETINYSVHFHVWSPVEILEIVAAFPRIGLAGLNLVLFHGTDHEMRMILQRTD